jgi:hypothetical protein
VVLVAERRKWLAWLSSRHTSSPQRLPGPMGQAGFCETVAVYPSVFSIRSGSRTVKPYQIAFKIRMLRGDGNGVLANVRSEVTRFGLGGLPTAILLKRALPFRARFSFLGDAQ